MNRNIRDGILQLSDEKGNICLRMTELERDGVIEVVCAGNLSSETVPEWEDEIRACLSVCSEVRLNLQLSDYISGASLNALLDIQREAEASEKNGVVLTGLSDSVLRTLEETGLTEILQMDPGSTLAQESFLQQFKEAGEGRTEPVRIRRDSTGEVLAEQDGELVLGRVPGQCDYAMPEQPGISGAHVRLIRREGQLSAEDLHSKNGTYRNGNRMEPGKQVQLSPGDQLRLYQEIFTVETIPGDQQ